MAKEKTSAIHKNVTYVKMLSLSSEIRDLMSI